MRSLTGDLGVREFDHEFQVGSRETISLITSAFVPMAYCRYGCPTGAVLKLFEFGPLDNGWNRRDYFSFALLGLALLLYSFS